MGLHSLVNGFNYSVFDLAFVNTEKHQTRRLSLAIQAKQLKEAFVELLAKLIERAIVKAEESDVLAGFFIENAKSARVIQRSPRAAVVRVVKNEPKATRAAGLQMLLTDLMESLHKFAISQPNAVVAVLLKDWCHKLFGVCVDVQANHKCLRKSSAALGRGVFTRKRLGVRTTLIRLTNFVGRQSTALQIASGGGPRS
jgi:hypothetical protein